MAINIYFQTESREEANKIREQFHYALKGSPAYISSEILLGDLFETEEGSTSGVVLLIGEQNQDDIDINLNISSDKISHDVQNKNFRLGRKES